MAGEFKSLKGYLLLDSGMLRGSFFHRTVVLICEHDQNGAFGLVLNRATNNLLGDMLVANLPDSFKNQPLFLGGPVQPSALSFLYTDDFSPDTNILPNLSLGHSLDTLIELGENLSPNRKIRVFAGYSGWSPGQLDNEIRHHAWITHPASIDLVFEENIDQLWRSIMLKKGGFYKLIADAPEDPSVN